MTAIDRRLSFAHHVAAGANLGVPLAPLIARKDHMHPSAFLPEVMLGEARKQKQLADNPVPPVCVLDPDGDIVVYVQDRFAARRSKSWACFHTELWEWETDGRRFGVVGRAVGASFAVLVAEQLFVSGCGLLISIASAGAIADGLPRSCYILIERALRDEGTSYHYLPPAPFALAEPSLFATALNALSRLEVPVMSGASWTTDAPFRETAPTIEERRKQGVHAVEMEAAALLAFAEARARRLIAIAHITNSFDRGDGNFDKGVDKGAETAVAIVAAIADAVAAAPLGPDAIDS